MPKYNIEIARKMFLDFGYILDEEEYVNCKNRMKCHDNDGYKYVSDIGSIKSGKKPRKFDVSNPYTIENIQHLLDIETNGTKILETEYHGNKHKMKFRCSCGDEYYTNLNEVVSSGKMYCEFCSRGKRFNGFIDYMSILNEYCNEKGYTLLTDNVTRSRQKIEYICQKHKDKGVQHTNYDVLVKRGHGCKYCGSEQSGLSRRKNIDKAIELTERLGLEYVGYFYAKKNHPHNSILFVEYICKVHRDLGVQVASYYDMQNRGFGCPSCKNTKYERFVEEVLIKNKIDYEFQFKFDDCRDKRPLPFDFYLKDRNILIEADGQYHFYPVNFSGNDETAQRKFEECQKHDKIKNEYCAKNNITLIRIPYYIFDDKDINIEEYILERI